ncbi:AraC family transcriptional regulator [Streptacidiphilus pinicola]|uniref:AraC family transcriptional regulator n=1 Tax=Streptacidiphilus pinicola TaxID=2219663 RepID=A0A2X0KKZ2_9ACTN|nr:AraC family transcriptional regulator [Streptacidiphilus pinicola]RAG87340.1 AraC family transcriptional regulator [Streptacidiphilus pinicola]
MTEMARAVRLRAGVPVYRYRTDPATPPVSVLRFDPVQPPGHGRRHIHDFPVLMYVESAGPAGRPGLLGPVADGDAFVVAPGTVIDPTEVAGFAAGRGVFFDPAALGGEEQAPWSSWRAHPLLLPFLHRIPGGLLRLAVPPARRPVWAGTIDAIEAELAGREDGFRQAVLAQLTLLLVDVARLATDVVGDLRRSNEPLLAEVFDVIERRYTRPLSLRDVADSIGLTPGHLTTVVRQRTGRTVVDWITERRMAEARRLLSGTDLPVAEIARRVGLPDAGYFARVFRAGHGTSPRAWRQAMHG